MGDVTRRWPRRTDPVLVLDGVVEDPPPVRQRAERDAATAAALRAYLQTARPECAPRVDARL